MDDIYQMQQSLKVSGTFWATMSFLDLCDWFEKKNIVKFGPVIVDSNDKIPVAPFTNMV